MKHAFSLVELSIVLVILGLLTGGILTGQNLIRAAELRSLTTDTQRYQAAIHTFRDKYFGLPGDLSNAEAFWGTDPDGCPSHTNYVAKTETCNGNGNGLIDTSNEQFRFWQQMAAAGLIEGSYTGVAGSGSATHSIPSVNVPAARISSVGFSISNLGNDYSSASVFLGDYGNSFEIGMARATGRTIEPMLTPTEMWGIDKKLDDGMPGRGKIVAYNWDDCTDAADNTDADADYALNTSAIECSYYYRNLF
jgi:prepilin-type N-terminal cleavage/methylation domain-containing protein